MLNFLEVFSMSNKSFLLRHNQSLLTIGIISYGVSHPNSDLDLVVIVRQDTTYPSGILVYKPSSSVRIPGYHKALRDCIN